MKTVTNEYLMGIKEGREWMEKYGDDPIEIQENIDGLESTLKGFNRNSPVGQMLLGELDFWKLQQKKAEK